jgi:hypothetical protein
MEFVLFLFYIIQIMESIQSTSKINYIKYIQNNILNNNIMQKLIKKKRYFSKANLCN